MPVRIEETDILSALNKYSNEMEAAIVRGSCW